MPLVGLVRPEALALLGVVALVAAIALWSEVRRGRALAAFAGSGAELSSASASGRRAKLALSVVAAAAAVVALSGPYFDVVERTVVQSGVDVVVALDVSQSMAVRDVEPDRLRAGKELIRRLGDGMTQSRVALVLFAGQGIVRYPSTADPSVLGQTLDSVSAGFKPAAGGSSLRGAVDAALGAFSEEARQSPRRKAVVLVTDGEETLGGAAPDVEALRAARVKLFTVGVGTASGGPIPTYDRSGRFVGYLRRADGTQITSRLDEAALRRLAETTEGRYFPLAGFDAAGDVMTELRRLDATALGEVPGGSVPDDRFQPFLAVAVLLLVAAEVLSDRRPMPRPRWLRGRAASLVTAVLVLGACGASAAAEADRAYLAGDHGRALELYQGLIRERPAVAELHVNAGNALHQLGRHPDALEEYAVAVRDGTPAVRAVAHYQRGNTLFRSGELEDALAAYKDALRLDPRDRDAKFNIELIGALIAVTQREGAQPGEPGQGQPGESAAPGPPAPGASGAPGGPPAPPGSEGPQASGPPTGTGAGDGQSLGDALREFRSELSAEQALDLLDALLRDQRGIEQLIEGSPQGPPRQDPTY